MNVYFKNKRDASRDRFSAVLTKNFDTLPDSAAPSVAYEGFRQHEEIGGHCS